MADAIPEKQSPPIKNGPGGKRPGAGRKKGVPNKATASIRDLAREYTADALNALTGVLADKTEPAAARVAAAKEILDRGYGKASTVLQGDEDGGPVKLATEIRLIGVMPDARGS